MGRRLLFVAIAATALIAPPAVTANQATMTRDAFLTTKWRLIGPMFSMVPFDGFPITFHPDGTVETRNLGGITRWSVDGDELVLSGDRHSRDLRLKWLPDYGVFRHCYVPGKIPLYVFPEIVKNPMRIGCGDVRAALLELQIALDKAVYRFGERIVVTATLTNLGDAPIFVRRSADETGHDDGFRVELTKYGGGNLQSPVPSPWHQPGVAESLPPGGTHSRQLVLTRMVGPLTPGKYRLTMIYSAPYPEGNIGIWSEGITLEITPQQ